jgi:hypothetical protein
VLARHEPEAPLRGVGLAHHLRPACSGPAWLGSAPHCAALRGVAWRCGRAGCCFPCQPPPPRGSTPPTAPTAPRLAAGVRGRESKRQQQRRAGARPRAAAPPPGAAAACARRPPPRLCRHPRTAGGAAGRAGRAAHLFVADVALDCGAALARGLPAARGPALLPVLLRRLRVVRVDGEAVARLRRSQRGGRAAAAGAGHEWRRRGRGQPACRGSRRQRSAAARLAPGGPASPTSHRSPCMSGQSSPRVQLPAVLYCEHSGRSAGSIMLPSGRTDQSSPSSLAPPPLASGQAAAAAGSEALSAPMSCQAAGPLLLPLPPASCCPSCCPSSCCWAPAAAPCPAQAPPPRRAALGLPALVRHLLQGPGHPSGARGG